MTRSVRLIAALLVYALTAAACGSNPNAPSKVQYTGTWNGTYSVTSCTPTGVFTTQDFCSELGNGDAFQLVLTQSTDNIVTGAFTVGGLPFQTLGANVASDGSLQLTGTTNVSGVFITVTFNLTEPSSTSLAGTIQQLWTVPGVSGQMTVSGPLNTTVKQ